MIHVLTDDEKNELVIKSERIIYYMANKYRTVDNDPTEILGWCYFGMAIAIAKFEQNPEENLVDLIFREIANVIKGEYFTSSSFQKTDSLDEPINGYEDLTLGGTIADESFIYDQEDILKMLDEAIFEENKNDREIIYLHLIYEYSANDISKEKGLRISYVKRVLRRGIKLLRTYLSNNDIISDYLLYPNDKKYEIERYEPLRHIDVGKIKYLSKKYPFLRTYDIAQIMNISTFSVSTVIDFPTVSYVRAIPDETIEGKAKKYCDENYPEWFPSEVKVYTKV